MDSPESPELSGAEGRAQAFFEFPDEEEPLLGTSSPGKVCVCVFVDQVRSGVMWMPRNLMLSLRSASSQLLWPDRTNSPSNSSKHKRNVFNMLRDICL